MNPTPQRADPLSTFADDQPLELTNEAVQIEPTFDRQQWSENETEARGAGGRQVLGTALTIIAALWLAYTAWLAGRSLVGQSIASPAMRWA